jgi:hypothetical protein
MPVSSFCLSRHCYVAVSGTSFQVVDIGFTTRSWCHFGIAGFGSFYFNRPFPSLSLSPPDSGTPYNFSFVVSHIGAPFHSSATRFRWLGHTRLVFLRRSVSSFVLPPFLYSTHILLWVYPR